MTNLTCHKLNCCAYDPILRCRKRTAIWTNAIGFVPHLCAGEGKCPSMVGACHRGTCTGSYSDPAWIECGRVSHALIDAVLDAHSGVPTLPFNSAEEAAHDASHTAAA